MISKYLDVNIIALFLGIVLVFSGVTMLSAENESHHLDVTNTSIEEPYTPSEDNYVNQDEVVSTYQAAQKEVVKD